MNYNKASGFLNPEALLYTSGLFKNNIYAITIEQ